MESFVRNFKPSRRRVKGYNPSELTRNHRWLRGQEFLWQPESSWPNVGLGEIPDEILELKKETSAYCTDVNACSESFQRKPMPERPTGERTLQWMISNSSDWDNLRRKVAWLIRFTHFVRDPQEVRIGCLTVEDNEAATLAAARIIQRSAYKQEIKDLEIKGTIKVPL